MAMASGLYGITFEDAFDATAIDPNLDTDSVKIALVTDTHTPDFNADDQYADVDNEIASGGGYTTGGNALDTPTWGTSGGFLTYDSADEAWTSATFSAVRGCIGYDDTLAGDPLLWATTFGADYSVSSGTLTVQPAATGWWRLDIIP